MGRWLPKEEREKLVERIIHLKEVEELTISQIAERMNMSHARIEYYWNKHIKRRENEPQKLHV